jgi:hypothetical protein
MLKESEAASPREENGEWQTADGRWQMTNDEERLKAGGKLVFRL